MTPHEMLKDQREQRRLSLHTVQKETRIPLAYLNALESGKWDVFPAEVYLLGSLRKYSSYLGLNADELVEFYKKELQESSLKKLQAKETGTPAQKKEKFCQQAQISFFILLLIFLGSWWIFTIVRTSPGEKRKAISTSLKEKLGRFSIIQGETLDLKVEAVETTWVRVSGEEKLLFEGYLPAGALRVWSSRKYFLLRAAKISSLRVSLNLVALDLNAVKRFGNEIVIDRQLIETKSNSSELLVYPSDSQDGPRGDQSSQATPLGQKLATAE